MGVLRADLFRYLVLFAHGGDPYRFGGPLMIGVYADADVFCAKPVLECIPADLWTKSSVIVGVELDEPSATKAVQKHWKWSRNHGFTQWTVFAKPFAEPLKLAIVRSISHTYALARLRGVSDPEKLHSGKGLFDYFLPSYTVKDILEVTGPGMWTDAVMDSINANSPKPEGVSSESHRRNIVTWSAFTRLRSPQLLGQILVLPINYFGSGQRHSGAGNFLVPEACVNHLAKRTWK
jgi:alpha 1,6-mannosyltransferase